ncbi:MAG: hypothetical protein IJO85_03830 [Lachnospiraceae bacterium]|nr:hypothetical protein [Lachnospiraceae bacterium]
MVIKMEVYNKNRDNNNSIHDEIREQNAKLKDAPLKEKLSYFKEYYLKTTLAVIAIAIFVGSLAYTMITAPDDTAFAAYFFNDTGDSSSTVLIDEFVAYTGIDTKEHEAYIDASMNYSSDSGNYTDYTGIEKTMAVIATNELDIIVGDQEAFDYFTRSECFHDVTTILPENLLEKFQDKIYYYTFEETGETVPVGIYVTDSPKLNENYYYVDKEPILGFLINSDSIENALTFLEFIYME